MIAARETGVLLALLVICVFLTFATEQFPNCPKSS